MEKNKEFYFLLVPNSKSRPQENILCFESGPKPSFRVRIFKRMSSSVKKYTIGLKDLILEGDIDKVIAHSTPSLTKLQFANLSFSLTIRITKTARERKRVRNKPRKEIVFSRLIALVFNTHCHWSEVSGRSI